MKALVALAALTITAPESATSTSSQPMYLISIIGLGLGENEYISEFKLRSWGVRYKAVCRIPVGWQIKAGSSVTAEGWLEGEGSHGVTWLRRSTANELNRLVLVTLDSGPDWRVMRDAGGSILLPPTFHGEIMITDDKRDRDRKLEVGKANFGFVPAWACPPPR